MKQMNKFVLFESVSKQLSLARRVIMMLITVKWIIKSETRLISESHLSRAYIALASRAN